MEALSQHLFLIQGDITELEVDTIVNAANNQLRRGSGVCGAIFWKAGPQLDIECEKIGYCATGEAVLTLGYQSKAKYIIHTVGPVYTGKLPEQAQLLANCYWNSLNLALQNRCTSIAFPAISTGIYGYPLRDASRIAIRTCRDFLKKHPGELDVYLVAFDEKALAIFQDIERRF